MLAIQEAVEALCARGVVVLSPADPRIVDAIGPFLFVASDRTRSVRLVEDRHLASIARSDFLWLVTPDGYTGPSTAMEIGFAVASGVPILSTSLPHDLTLRQYVLQIHNLDAGIVLVGRNQGAPPAPLALAEPLHSTPGRELYEEEIRSQSRKASEANEEQPLLRLPGKQTGTMNPTGLHVAK
jgi:hypothetical protein